MKRRPQQITNFYKEELRKLFESNPEAKKLESKYRVLAFILSKQFPQIMQSASPDTMKEFLKDVLYLDRQVRWETEDTDIEIKRELEVETLKELGY